MLGFLGIPALILVATPIIPRVRGFISVNSITLGVIHLRFAVQR
jgi:hypothetical protein